MLENVRLKVLPPWVTHINMIQALFDGDPQIACNVNCEGSNPSITLACNNGDKVAALYKILPSRVEFGNVVLEIIVDGVPSNRIFKNKKEIFDVAFEKNPAYAYSVSPVDEGYYWFDMVYVVFKNCVVQFFNDNLNDCHGIVSTLYENIAREVLTTNEAVNGVYFNTDVEVGKVGKPLGEWP